MLIRTIGGALLEHHFEPLFSFVLRLIRVSSVAV